MNLIWNDVQTAKRDEILSIRCEEKWDFIQKNNQQKKDTKVNENVKNVTNHEYLDLILEINNLKEQNFSLKQELKKEVIEKNNIIQKKDKLLKMCYSDNTKLKSNIKKLSSKANTNK